MGTGIFLGFTHHIEGAPFGDERCQGQRICSVGVAGLADVDGAEAGQGAGREVLGLFAAFGVRGEGAFEFAGRAGGRLGVGAQDADRVLGVVALGPAVELLEGALVERGRLEPAAEQGFGGIGDGGVHAGLGAYGGQQGDRPGGGGVAVGAAGGGVPVHAGRGVAQVRGVVEEDRAEFGAGVLGLGPQGGGGGDDQRCRLRLVDGLDGGAVAGDRVGVGQGGVSGPGPGPASGSGQAVAVRSVRVRSVRVSVGGLPGRSGGPRWPGPGSPCGVRIRGTGAPRPGGAGVGPGGAGPGSWPGRGGTSYGR
ncbi:hypothetical protein GCM10020254_46200 [Streptomyces goshikiensis]